MKYSELEQNFEQFKIQNKLSKKIILKSADGRLGKKAGIFKETITGSITPIANMYTYDALSAWMEGYTYKSFKNLNTVKV